MNDHAMTRRQAMTLLGASAALAPSLASAAVASKGAPVLDSGAGDARALIAPLEAGSTLGTWTIESVGQVQYGAVSLTMRGAGGGLFYLDICARDRGEGAHSPPARTEHYDIFVANEGNGSLPTHEDHGLAAMALAEVVRANEQRVTLAGMLTHAQRLQRHRDLIRRG